MANAVPASLPSPDCQAHTQLHPQFAYHCLKAFHSPLAHIQADVTSPQQSPSMGEARLAVV